LRLLVEHGLVVTMDRERRILEDGAVVVVDGVIRRVCRSDELVPGGEFDRTIDASRMAVMPGLVNAHTHLNEKLVAGATNQRGFLDWLTTVAAPQMVATTRQDCHASAQLCCLEMITSGTTCFADMFCQHTEPRILDTVVDAVRESGVRAVLGRFCIEEINDPGSHADSRGAGGKPSRSTEMLEMVLEDTLKTREDLEASGSGTLQIRLAPGGMMGFSAAQARRIGDLAITLGVGIHTHLSETRAEVAYMVGTHGLRPVEFANRHGLLGPHVLGAHCIHLTEREIALLARTGTSAVYNPVANMKLAVGVAPVPRMLHEGVNVALGTDGSATNDSLDMFEAMKFGSYLQKIHNRDAALMPSEKVLEMATLGGARALQMEDQIGSIEPPKRADMILIDLSAPNLVPTHPGTIVNQIVCSATGANVDTVLVDGEVIMENRRVIALDAQRVIQMAAEASRALIERAFVVTSEGLSSALH
jgi:5-methylthioadenosine/S-adenosylhomocysteine deaminase